MQTNFDFIQPKQALTLNKIQFGIPFRFPETMGYVHMRIKPVNFLLNSSLISDVINRGDVLVCNLERGTVYVTRGDRSVQLLDAEVKVKGVL